DGNQNKTNYEPDNGIENSFTVPGISEGIHNWTVECEDSDLNIFKPESRNFTIDQSPPIIILESPEDEAGIDYNEGEIFFTWRAIDELDNILQCNLTVGGEVVEENQWISSNSSHSERITSLTEGYYEWNVTCWDQMKNSNTSETRGFNLTYPDFFVENITFNSSSFYEGESVLINSTIKNLGGADSNDVIVSFYLGDPSDGGISIENKTIDINKTQTLFVTSEYETEIGDNLIFVIVDVLDDFQEFNESNNNFSRTISVGSWQFFYGDILSSSEYELAGNDSEKLISWQATNFENGNLFAANSESSISWLDLIEIGKDLGGDNSSNDFSEIDSLLNMSGLEDSVSSVYTTAGEINNYNDFIVFGKILEEVPVANSINNSNFITGILWDSFNDSDGEFSSLDKEDLVFVAKVNPDSDGSYGNYDYELRVPAKLREYKNSNLNSVMFYVEIW
ncbi:hypothetical protein K9L16_00325, partial [Candidatus Pacearchaeota archaeon]|nr:hypothetical protein [Candidatus Pacearchaeota archaeon]